MSCKCKGTGRRDGFSEYLDCMEPGCNAAVERAEFNKRLKEAGSMSVEDAAWFGRQDSQRGWISVEEALPPFGKYVLARHTRGTWRDSTDQANVNCVVLKLVEGNRGEPNNLRPYWWAQFGPDSFFGQDISHWMPIQGLTDHPA